MKPNLSRTQVVCIAYVVLHLVLHFSATWFEVSPGISVSVWYPPCGLAFALLVLLGPRYTWLVFLINFTAAWFTDTPRIPWTGFFFPALLTANYGLTAWLVRRFHGSRLLPGERWGTLVFCLAVIGAPLISATIGTAVISTFLMEGRTLTALQFSQSVLDWWIGDASGLLVVVPVIMVFVEPWLNGRAAPPDIVRGRGGLMLDVALWVGLFGSLLAVIAVPVLREHSAFYLCFLPLVWICVRRGLRGATLATLLAMFVGLIGMRLAGTTRDFSYIFLLFEVAVAGVGLGLGTLVTRRNEAEKKLAASEARLDRVISGAQLGLWDWDISAQHVGANRRLSTMLGYEPEELEPFFSRWKTLIHPEDHARADAALHEHMEGRRPLYEAEFRLKAKNGDWRWIQSRGSVVERDDRGKPLRFSGTHADVTDRKRAEAEVRRLLKVIEATPDFVLKTDANGRLIYANVALLTWWSRDEALPHWKGRELTELFPASGGKRMRDEAIAAATARGSWQGEVTLTDSQGVELPTSQVVLAHRDEEHDTYTFSFIMRDMSVEKRAEAARIEQERRLLKLQKSESLVVLAGGIAHDFNNLLTAIVGNANLARFAISADSPAQDHLHSVETAATRASALCQQMLSYAGRTPVAFAELDLNILVDDTIGLLESSVSSRVTLMRDLGRPLGIVLGANTQIQQLITNLVLNAAEAIGEAEGRVNVRTRSRDFWAEDLTAEFPGAELAPGPYTIVEVEDNGSGMTPEVRARMFEPFFTTKFTGQGLGLAAVEGVVRAHRGAIAVRSAVGKGTLVRVAFPSLPISRASKLTRVPVDLENWRGEGVLLLVDDDRLILEVAGMLLQNLGFEVVRAKDGLQAVEIFREQSRTLRCVLMDITMPRMDGLEALAKMQELDRTVPVVLMSGYSEKLENLADGPLHPTAVLPKPFALKHLRARLASVLGNSSTTRKP